MTPLQQIFNIHNRESFGVGFGKEGNRLGQHSQGGVIAGRAYDSISVLKVHYS